MKNLKIYAMLLLGVAAMSSCTDDLMGGKGEGWIQISGVSTDKSITAETRAGEEPAMAVDIVDAEGSTFVHADDWTAIQGESYLVKAGNTYTVKAYTAAGDAEAEGFDATPYYEGSSNVTVKAGQAQTVDVTCRLAQAKLSVSYSEAWTTHMTNFTAEVRESNVVFEGEESRSAYLKAGRSLVLRLNFTPQGKTLPTYVEKEIAATTEAATHYNVAVDVNTDGQGNITVDVDQTIHEYKVSLGIPLEDNGVVTNAINGDYSRVWGTSATLSGYVNETTTAPIQFLYRQQGTEEWTTVDAQQVGETNEYTYELTGLSMGTAYDYQIVSGELKGDVLSFTTEKYEEVPNLGLEDWTQKGKNWYPNAVAGGNIETGAYWSSGNEGVTMALVGKNANTTPSTDIRQGSTGTRCAQLVALTNVAFSGSAAGNLFIGKFKANPSDPASSVTFGRPYSGARPRKLKGWYKYTSKPIDSGSYDNGTNITSDVANIYIKLWDAAGNQIGFGELQQPNSVSDWEQFCINVNYTDVTKPAASITIVATTSLYGGEFDGLKVKGKVGGGSTLWVDDFELEF